MTSEERKAKRKVIAHNWYVKNRYRLKRPKEYYAAWREKHRERARQIALAHYHRNRDEQLKRRAIQRESRKDELLTYHRKYRAHNSEKLLEYGRRYREKNRKDILKRHKKWRLRNRPKLQANCHQRRARVKGAILGNPESIQIWMKEVRSKPFARCHWCGTKVHGKRVHFDHVIALGEGGTHSIGNLCASCPECNLSKQAKSPSEWGKHNQIFLSL